MAVVETNYDRVETEKFYKETKLKKFNVPDSLVDILEALSIYCDEHTASYPNGCFNCPFYIPNIECSCLISQSGYDAPCHWAVYKDEEVGDVNT